MSIPSSRLVEQTTAAQFAVLEPVFDLKADAAIERRVVNFDLVRQFGE